MSDDFYRTNMGRKFYESTLPALVAEVGRLANGVERVARLLEEERVARGIATVAKEQSR